MTTEFLPAFEYVMQYEDSRHTWCAATDNNGGMVIAGINSKSFPLAVVSILAMGQSQREPAIQTFYRNNLWVPMQLGGLDSQDLANRVMDMETNSWEPQAAHELQKAINVCTPGRVTVDGVVGPLTIAAANAQNQTFLLNAFRAQRVSYYDEIAVKNSSDQKYLNAWLARAQA